MPHVLRNASALLLSAALLPEGPAQLVVDLDADRGPTSEMRAQSGVTLGDRVVFASSSGLRMRLWATDGSASGTRLLREFVDDLHGMEMAALNGRVIFSAFDYRYGRELWQTDGTAAGTTLLKDILPGELRGDPRGFAEYRGFLYFAAHDGIHGSELWRTDGTPEGTTIALDLEPGANGGSPEGIIAHRGSLYFFTFESWSTRRYRLWRSDGSIGGTVPIGIFFRTGVSGVCAIICDYGPSPLVPHGERLFFLGNDGSTGHELWSTDGTSAGTTPVRDIVPGPGSGAALVTSPVAAAGTLFFIARDPASGQELWTSDGTSDGTRLLLDLTPGAGDTYFDTVVGTPDRVMFGATGIGTGSALWTSDGTTSGTVPLVPGLRLIGARELDSRTVVSGSLGQRSGLWTTDGTPAGTQRLLDTRFPVSLVESIRGRFLFAAESAGGFGLWDTDGATVSLSPIARLHTGAASSNPTLLTDVSGRLFFGATVGGLFNALHVTDRTEGGTVQIPGVSLHDSGTASNHPVAFQGRLYFLARDAAHGIELWTSDGTEAGTHLVKDIAPGSADSQIFSLSVAGGRLYFRANDGSHGSEPWSSDGTAEGTRLVKDIYPGSQDGSAPSNFVDMGGAVFFSANSSVGRELWRTDGTPQGTLLVKDIRPGSGEVPFSWILSTGSSLYFSADDGIHGSEMWSSDGTETGTRLLVDLRQGPEGSAPYPLVTLRERVVFRAAPGGDDLWVTDGTEVGTQRLTNSVVTGSYLQTIFWTASERTLYFWAQDLTGQKWELWRSDATPAGTVLVSDLPRVQVLGSPYNLIAIDDVLLFTFNDPDSGSELWVSDGTRKGTRMLQDISPGIGSSSPNLAERSGDFVYFTASNEAAGRELWTIPVATLRRGSKQIFLRPEAVP